MGCPFIFEYVNVYTHIKLIHLKLNRESGNNMKNVFSIIGLIGVVLFIAGFYFIDNGRYVYFLGIALMTAGFIGIKKTG